MKPRRVSAVFWPVTSPEARVPAPSPELPEAVPLSPVFWGDWPRCQVRRRWLRLVRTETVGVALGAIPPPEDTAEEHEPSLTRAQRAHWRLTWWERFARNERPSTAPPLEVTLHGLPTTFAHTFGFDLTNVA